MKLSVKALLSLMAVSPANDPKAVPGMDALLPEPIDPVFRMTDVFSALPPAQVPAWFKQRCEGDPLFPLQEFRQLSLTRRQQMMALVEKTLDARHCRGPRTDSLSLFLAEARRFQGSRAAR